MFSFQGPLVNTEESGLPGGHQMPHTAHLGGGFVPDSFNRVSGTPNKINSAAAGYNRGPTNMSIFTPTQVPEHDPATAFGMNQATGTMESQQQYTQQLFQFQRIWGDSNPATSNN